MTQSFTQAQPNRIEIEARIVRRLQHLDDDLLRKLDQIAGEAEEISLRRSGAQVHTPPPSSTEPADARTHLSRRQLITRLALGGSALAAVGYLVTREPEPAPTESPAVGAGLEILLSLYEMMDRVGLDRLVASALVVLGFSLNGLHTAATALRSALDFVAGMVDRFESAVPQILSGLQAVDEVLDTLQGYLDQFEALIDDVLEEAEPLTNAVDRFVENILSLLPFGMGERIQQALQIMGDMIGLLPLAIGTLGEGLLSPIRTWFPTGEAEDMRALLFTPIRSEILQPTAQLLDDLIAFTQRWDEELVQPVEESLAQREAIRTQIVAYKERIGITFDAPPAHPL